MTSLITPLDSRSAAAAGRNAPGGGSMPLAVATVAASGLLATGIVPTTLAGSSPPSKPSAATPP